MKPLSHDIHAAIDSPTSLPESQSSHDVTTAPNAAPALDADADTDRAAVAQEVAVAPAVAALPVAAAPVVAADAVVAVDAVARNGQADFDFLIGSWHVHNRRLRQPLRGSTEWYEFEGTNVARRVWDGSANMDEYDAVTPQGRIQGMTIRIYQHDTRQWRIYWANRANGVIDPPMQGTFTQDGRGEFYSHEQFNGQGILVRFLWTVLSPAACRWEQAFSADGGRSWETNWIMNMTRAAR